MAHTVEVNTPLEALLVEQALAMVRELKGVADAAADGRRPGPGRNRPPCGWAASSSVALWRRRCRPKPTPPKKGAPAASVPAAAAVTPRAR